LRSVSFEGLWHQHDFELPPVAPASTEEKQNYCIYARKFSEWSEELCVGALSGPSLVSINQAKVLLLDKYMEWGNSVPKKHRTYTAGGHTCIFHTFIMAYNRLRVVELSLTPPMLFIPPPPLPPPPPPPPPQIAGVFIGELEDE
jgi:hypothetical protein